MARRSSFVAPDQRLDLAGLCPLIQVHREAGERVLAGLLLLVVRLRIRALAHLERVVVTVLVDAVGDVVHDVEAGEPDLVHGLNGVRVRLGEDGDEDVLPLELVLPARLHVEGRAVEDALEAAGRVRLRLRATRQLRELLLQDLVEQVLQLLDVSTGLSHDARCLLVVQQGVEQVLDRHDVVPSPHGFAQSERTSDFDFSADLHESSPNPSGSAVHLSGCPCSLA